MTDRKYKLGQSVKVDRKLLPLVVSKTNDKFQEYLKNFRESNSSYL